LADASSAEIARRARGRKWPAAIASLLLVAVFVWILGRGGFPLLPPAGWRAKLDPLHFTVFCAAMVFALVAKLARCHFLLAPLTKLPFRRVMTINAIGLLLITYLPFRLGEVARPAMLREKGRLSAWAITATVGAERILDGVVFSGLLLIGLSIATPRDPLPDHVGTLPVPVWLIPQTARAAALLFAAAFVVMAAFYWLRAQARRVTQRLLGLVSHKLANRVADVVERLSDGLRFLTNLRYSLPYLAVTLASVLSQAGALQQLAAAVGMPELDFMQAVVVLGVLALGFSVPNAPGFFGVVQLALYAGLASYIAPEKVASEGAVFVFLYYVVYLLNVTLAGVIALAVELAFRRPPVRVPAA
jgi:membrane protein implicated in regulation of membrane protease activity